VVLSDANPADDGGSAVVDIVEREQIPQAVVAARAAADGLGEFATIAAVFPS
jgi:hypothetical protein